MPDMAQAVYAKPDPRIKLHTNDGVMLASNYTGTTGTSNGISVETKTIPVPNSSHYFQWPLNSLALILEYNFLAHQHYELYR